MLEEKYEAAPQPARKPTQPALLPTVRRMLERSSSPQAGQKTSDRCCNKVPGLAEIINAVAVYQGLKPIGLRSSDVAPYFEIKKRLDRQAAEISELRSLLAEQGGHDPCPSPSARLG